MGVTSIIKRIFMKPKWLECIYDETIYGDNNNSFCGNSLNGTNVLLVTNNNLNELEVIKKFIAEKEQCEVAICPINDVANIEHYGSNLVGKFDHIINIFQLTNTDNVYEIYHILQLEADYLVNKRSYSTVCTAVKVSEQVRCGKVAIEGLVEGIGWVMPNHKIIANGLLASEKIELIEIVKSAIFLSGKYGQILTGNVIKLG